jgi:energy-coupling factor transporter ATP-binding protein EcfA2
MKRHEFEDNLESGEGRASAELITQCAADITPEPVEWLWSGRVALGKLTLIAGEPGLGKSQVVIAMAAAVTSAGEWPCREGRAPQGNVVILSAEDDVADTIVPRLMAAGADLKRVRIIRAVQDPAGRRGFNLTTDLELLEKEIARLGDVRFVTIDPISSYLGPKVDSHVNASVRAVLEPVNEMAARLRIAIVAITHQPKGTGTAAIHRFIGSIAFVAAARGAFMVTRDPEDKDRYLFLPVKNNLARLGNGLAYRLEQRRLVENLDHDIVASSVTWESEPVTISADQALQATDAQAGGQVPAGADAEEFLRDALADGAIAVKDLQADAKQAGLSWATIRRAKDRVGAIVERKSHGFGGKGEWLWRLPDDHKMLIPSTRCSSPGMSTLCEDEHLVGATANGGSAPADEVSTLGKNELPEPQRWDISDTEAARYANRYRGVRKDRGELAANRVLRWELERHVSPNKLQRELERIRQLALTEAT